MPKWFKSLSVTLVSSAAIKSTLSSVCTALGEKSERLPIGVPVTYKIPLIVSLQFFKRRFVTAVNFHHFFGKITVFVLNKESRKDI